MGEVSLRGLKQWASDILPRGSCLRDVLLVEPDTLCIDEFLAKTPNWLKLARIEDKDGITHSC